MVVLSGISAGIAHVVSGPDHLLGVAPLAVEQPGRIPGWRVGAAWGLGHGLGVALMGGLGHTLLTVAGIEVASGWAERLVGVLLIVLGAVAVRRARSMTVHVHAHTHGDEGEHVHVHVHGAGAHAHAAGGDGHGHRHTALGVGALHGLAGGGHFWAVLPSLAMSRADAAFYIAGYALSSTAVMALFGAALERLAGRFGVDRLPRFVAAVGAATQSV
ncbi:MAG: hydantoin utilization protein A, partial [Planctomycetota bacterium]